MIATEIQRSRILVLLCIGKYVNVELNLFKLADQNNSRTCSLTKSSNVLGRLKLYENICSPYIFVCLKPSLLPSISVHFQSSVRPRTPSLADKFVALSRNVEDVINMH